MVDTIQSARGVGAPAGRNGVDGVGIAQIAQIDATRVRVTLTNKAVYVFALPRGLPGEPGQAGVNPILRAGQLVLRPYGTAPRVEIVATDFANVYAVNFYLPDPGGSADAAAASAAQAQTSETNAVAAASQATSAATALTAAFDSFDDRYLGAFSADPTADNDGQPLLVGALYYNSGAQPGMRVRTAAGTWDNGYAVITGAVSAFNGRVGNVAPVAGDYGIAQISGLIDALATKYDASNIGPAIATKADAIIVNTQGQDIRALALYVAELKGDRLNMKDGIADPFGDASDINAALSSGYAAGTGIITPNIVNSANICLPAYAITNSGPASAGSAFDTDTTASYWQSNSGISLNGTYLGQDFGAGNAKIVKQYAIKWSGPAFNGGGIYFQYSDDLVTWTSVAQSLITNVPSSAPQYMTGYANLAVGGNVGAHRAWRIISNSATASDGAAAAVRVIDFQMFAPSVPVMTLVSSAFVSEIGVPSTARLVAQVAPVKYSAAPVANTDFILSASRDGGTTFTAATLAYVETLADGSKIYEASVSLTSQPSGSSMVWRLQTFNNKDVKLAGIVFQWRA